MSISRRTALLATGAAAITTGVVTAPLVAKAALAGDPVLPAFEAYEAARLEGIAASNHRLEIVEAVQAELPPEPHRDRDYLELSDAEHKAAVEWRVLCQRHVTARLGMHEDDLADIYYDRTMSAYETVADTLPGTAPAARPVATRDTLRALAVVHRARGRSVTVTTAAGILRCETVVTGAATLSLLAPASVGAFSCGGQRLVGLSVWAPVFEGWLASADLLI